LRGDPDARLARGWRAELVGEPIRRLLDGEVALAFERGGGLRLEPRTR
jgi:ribonuclease D